MKRSTFFLALAMTLTCTGFARAADFEGAVKVVDEVKAYRPPGAEAAEAKPVSLSAQWNAKVDALAKTIDTLAPNEAVTQWLALYDQLLVLPNKSGRSWYSNTPEESVGFHKVMLVLPKPDAWPELAAQAQKREIKPGSEGAGNLCLLFIVHTLMNDRDAQVKDVVKLKENTRAIGAAYSALGSRVENFSEEFARQFPQAPLAAFEAALDETSSDSTVEVPNLVGLAGEEKARALLSRALKSQKVLTFRRDDQTSALAREIALKDLEQLKRAQWGLINNLSSGALFEAMEAKFLSAKPKENAEAAKPADALSRKVEDFRRQQRSDNTWVEAADYYVAGLVAKGRVDDALAFLKKHPVKQNEWSGYSALSEYPGVLDQYVDADMALAFFDKLTAQEPERPVWDRFISAGARAGKSQGPIDRIKKLLQDPGTRSDLKVVLKEKLTAALLAGGQMQEAIAMMMEEFRTSAQTQPGLPMGSDKGVFQRAVQLLKATELQPDVKLQEEAVRIATDLLEKASEDDNTEVLLATVVWHELGNKRPQNAEAIIKRALMKSTYKDPAAQSKTRNAYRYGRYGVPERTDIQLQLLAQVYFVSGRHADVLVLLDTAPWWNSADLAGYVRDGRHSEKDTLPKLPIMAATALKKAGRDDEARRIVYAVLDQSPGLDDAYALLLELDGDGAMKKLDELFARDRFEERPLIWKAQLLLNQKKLDEAEKTVKQAMAIDPSDGEQGHGARMRVYAVLRDILTAKGQTKDAEIYANVVKAIRLAEEADKVFASGQTSRAIKMYEESLTLFSDAYCIQSRLAVQLMAAGRVQEAEVHYRKAFELMPDSFGRVESHCFGCEGVFSGGVAQSVAERVFARLVKETPEKPQVHYLLGYLRETQGRDTEALVLFKEAVKLDPDYLNAWGKVQSRSGNGVDPAAADQALANVIRLDPLGRHTYPDFGSARDLKMLWTVLAGIQPSRPGPVKDLYPLRAKAKALGEQKKSIEEDQYAKAYEMMRERDEQDSHNPRVVIREKTAIKGIEPVIDSIGNKNQ